MTDHCVCCGDILPEGRMVCPQCERQEIRGADKKSAICAFLKEHHTGKSRAIHSKELQRLFLIDGRNLRRKISALRQDGYPICSDECGYYYADNQKEINDTVCRLNGLVTQVSNARTGLLFASIFPSNNVRVEIKIYENGGGANA